MDERCFRSLFAQSRLNWAEDNLGLWDAFGMKLPQCSIDYVNWPSHTVAHRATSDLAASPIIMMMIVTMMMMMMMMIKANSAIPLQNFIHLHQLDMNFWKRINNI